MGEKSSSEESIIDELGASEAELGVSGAPALALARPCADPCILHFALHHPTVNSPSMFMRCHKEMGSFCW